jgi:Bacteriophage tail sheath protein
MTEYLAPGIYLRPKPEAKRDVRLVRTDVAAFVGYAERGPLVYPGAPDEVAKRLPVRITSWKEFRTTFGGFTPNGLLAYAVKGFFENGGTTAYVVRAAATHVQAIDERPRAAALLFPAGGPAPPGLLLTLAADAAKGARTVVVAGAPGINTGAQLAIASGGVTDTQMVVGRDNDNVRLAGPLGGTHAAADATVTYYSTGLRFEARSKGGWGNRIRVTVTPLEVAPDPGDRDRPGRFTDFSLRIVLDPGPDTSAPAEEEFYNRLSLEAGSFNVSDRINAVSNLVQVTASGTTFFNDPTGFGTPRSLEGGQDGLRALTERDILGSDADLRGVRLFEEIDDIGILCVPDAVFAYQAPKPPPPPNHGPCDPPPAPPAQPAPPPDPTARPAALDSYTIYVGMIDQCERLRDRVAVIDTPQVTRGAAALLAWRKLFATRFAALYYPWLEVPDALNPQGGTRPIPPSGHVAGIYAYTDNAFGVQRPPANAELNFVGGVVDDIDAHLQENLNPFDVNAVRSFPGRGIRVWGARSLARASDSDWRFIHVRRLMSMVEKSVEKSMQWAVFEPNDYPLRRTLTHSLNVFLETIWRTGGLKGAKPSDGFFVKCDETNNPQSVIEAGQLICQVGIAVAAPMEFIVFEIRQGGAQTELLEQ